MSFLQSRLSRIANLDSPFRTGILACLVTVLCYLAAKVGGAVVLRPQMVWPLWPGCALLVAVLLLVPRKVWPIFIAAGLAGFVLYDLRAGLPHRSMALLVLADTVEVLIAALGVSYSFAGDVRLNSVESLAKYSFFAVFLAPVSAAFVGAALVGENYWAGWRISYFTESLALLTLTPAILTWARLREAWPQRSRAHYLEAIALISGLVPLCYIAFVTSGRNSAPVLLYSLLPFLLWSALRFGLMGISTTMIIVDVLSTWGAVHGGGPFTGSVALSNVLSLQLFLFFAATPFMVLAVLVEERRRAEQATRESEKRFRLVADTAPALIWMSTTDKLCCYFNKPWLDFTGRSIDSELGNGWADGIHPEDFPRCMDTYTRAFDRREQFRMEYRLRRHDGEYRWVLDIGVPRFNPDGSFVGYIGIGIDVTDGKQAEAELRQSEERLSLAAQVGKMYAYEWDVATDVVIQSEEHASVLGFSDQGKRLTSRELLARVYPDDRALFISSDNQLTPENPTTKSSYRVVRPDGSLVWLEKNARGFFDEQSKMLRMVGMVADITERKRAEDALSNVRRKLINAVEQERARIARELHDDIGQRLALLTAELEQLQQHSRHLPAEVRNRVGELGKQTAEIVTDIQSMSHELHSSKLQYLGLAVAMRSFCREFGEQEKMNIEFSAHNLPTPLPADTSLCLFRVLQEALHNSAKHSGGRQFEVRLWATSADIHLTVEDFGLGFDVERAQLSRGLGLISMEERLKLVDGELSIESKPQLGTTIHARVPLKSGGDSMRAAV